MDENNNTPINDEAFEMPGKKEKKSKLPIVFGVLLVLCIALTAAAIYMMRPETKIKRELTLNAASLMSRESFADAIGAQTALDAFYSGDYDTKGSIQLEKNNVYEKINGIGFSFKTTVSREQKKISSNNSVDYSGMNLAAFQTYTDEERTSLYIPSLFKESFTLENENIVSQFRAMPFMAEKLEGADEFCIKPFEFIDMLSSGRALKGKVKPLAAIMCAKVLPQLKYSKNGKVTAADGKTYDSYIVTVPAATAKEAYTAFLNDIGKSAEYSDAMNKMLDFFYAFSPITEEKMGKKEDVEMKLNAVFDGYIMDIENCDTDDINIIATPIDNGIAFDVDHTINGKNLKMNGAYYRNSGELKLKGTYTAEKTAFDFDYTDKNCRTEDGVTVCERSIELASGGNNLKMYSYADVNADGTLNAAFNYTDNGKELKSTLEGKTENENGTVKLTADKLVIEAEGESAELSGELSFGARVDEPQDVNAPEDIKIKEIDIKKLIELYGEAQTKLESLKKFSKLF